jgi:hypothetical protein
MSNPYVIDNVQLSEAQVERLVAEREARRSRFYYFTQTLSRPYYYRVKEAEGHGEHWVNGAWERTNNRYDCLSAYRGKLHLTELTYDEFLAATTKPPVTFAVGDWVQHKTQPWTLAKQVADTPMNGWVNVKRQGACGWTGETRDLRHATPEEVRAAKAIESRDGVIVRGKESGAVLRLTKTFPVVLTHPSLPFGESVTLRHPLTTDHYTVLDSYTVTGAK